jgi:hypothetical protein
MKQILAMNYAVIEAEEVMIINHPTTIFTDDDIAVSVYDTVDQVNESLIDANVWSPTGYPAGWRKL